MPFLSPGYLSDPGIKPTSPALAGEFFTTQPSGKPVYLSVCVCVCVCMYSHIFFLHSSVDGHLGCFCVLAIVKSAAMNIRCMYFSKLGFPGGASGKEPAYQCRRLRDEGLIAGSGRPPGAGNGNPLQYVFLENPMDRGAWQATVHRVAKSLSTWHAFF